MSATKKKDGLSKTALVAGSIYVLAHVLIVAPFVPLLNILPAALGAVSMSSMALCLILAARWRLVDRILGGPDKSYVAHRWLGFFAVAGMLGHWALASSVGAGVLPVLAESGEDVGVLAAMTLLVLTVAALIRAIPYHIWKASHMLLGPAFLVACYHTFFVASPLAVGALPWTLMAIVSVVGLAAWVQTLVRKSSRTRLVKVESLQAFDGGIDVSFRSDGKLPTFQPGQFATIAYDKARAEAHPFTIAGGNSTSRRFVIRSAGDWTSHFVNTVKVGDEFRVSGGYGRFLPQIRAKRLEQLWVAGGVGITPFLAALEQMQPDKGAKVTLVYCIRSRASAGAIDDVEAHARRLPQLNLIVVSDEGNERLTPEWLSDIVSHMDSRAEVYLCGPLGLKNLVTDVWGAQKMRGKVHGERFDFRGAYGMNELVYIGKPVLDRAREWVSDTVSPAATKAIHSALRDR